MMIYVVPVGGAVYAVALFLLGRDLRSQAGTRDVFYVFLAGLLIGAAAWLALAGRYWWVARK